MLWFLERVLDAARWVVWGCRVVLSSSLAVFRAWRGGTLGASLEPWQHVSSVDVIDFDALATQGIKAALFDLENTLIPPGGPFTEEGRRIVQKVKGAGLKIAVVTNCSATWARNELKREGIPYVAPAAKPMSKGFLKGCVQLGVDPSEAVYIGDQAITDVMGSQLAGLKAIQVPPRWTTEPRSSVVQRKIVKALRKVVA